MEASRDASGVSAMVHLSANGMDVDFVADGIASGASHLGQIADNGRPTFVTNYYVYCLLFRSAGSTLLVSVVP